MKYTLKFTQQAPIIKLMVIVPIAFVFLGIGHVLAQDVRLSADEKEGIVYAVEEIQLTRDVADFIWDRWQLHDFKVLLQEEEQQLDQLAKFVKSANGIDLMAHRRAGQYNIPNIQDKYDQYVLQANQSKVASLFIGAAMAEMNYLSMSERLNLTEDKKLRAIYTDRLLNSEFTLRQMVWNLAKMKVMYLPQFISERKYQQIMKREGDGPVTEAI